MTDYQLLKNDLEKSITDLKNIIARYTIEANVHYSDLLEFGLESSNYWYNHYTDKVDFCRLEIARLQSQLETI